MPEDQVGCLVPMRVLEPTETNTPAIDTGQTFFMGHRPVHVHFFTPEYRPQLEASPDYISNECVIIAKEFVEEYALLELGFHFSSPEAGSYSLDSRLTYVSLSRAY